MILAIIVILGGLIMSGVVSYYVGLAVYNWIKDDLLKDFTGDKVSDLIISLIALAVAIIVGLIIFKILFIVVAIAGVLSAD
jgi:hypothetical protein